MSWLNCKLRFSFPLRSEKFLPIRKTIVSNRNLCAECPKTRASKACFLHLQTSLSFVNIRTNSQPSQTLHLGIQTVLKVFKQCIRKHIYLSMTIVSQASLKTAADLIKSIGSFLFLPSTTKLLRAKLSSPLSVILKSQDRLGEWPHVIQLFGSNRCVNSSAHSIQTRHGLCFVLLNKTS